jgi:hypothetical protein
LFLIPWFLCLCMWWRFFFGSCFCLRPENRPNMFIYFLRCDMLGEGGGVGGAVITSCVYVIIDFLR